jgi:hypothetical protein
LLAIIQTVEEPETFDLHLDSQYLKLDEGALSFIFSRALVEKAKALGVQEAQALVRAHHAKLVEMMGTVTARILKDAFYTDLFEQLARQPEDLSLAFVNLALRRVEDEAVEAARAGAVAAYLKKRGAGRPVSSGDSGHEETHA